MTDTLVEPVAYRHRYTDPLSGKLVWRRTSENWNGQKPSASEPLYPASALTAAQAEIAELKRERERRWCLSCGTVTRDDECDCSDCSDVHDFKPNLVNYADELQRMAAKATNRATAAEATATRLQGEVDALKETLRPFQDFAENNTDEHGWSGTRCERERIRDWFGPSDFRRTLTKDSTNAG